MTVFEVKVYFDVICAWCYIGHRTLFQAISLFQKTYPGASQDTFNIHWMPFYRDRDLPSEGAPLQDRLVSVFGKDRTNNQITRVQRIGRAHGINFTFNGIIGHTRDCQRLIHWAGAEKQRELIEQIYFRWFEQCGDITSHAFLKGCAVAVGMNEDNVVQFLASGQYADEIDQLDARAREEGISSIPTFHINGTRIEGAEEASTFYELFVKAKGGDTWELLSCSRKNAGLQISTRESTSSRMTAAFQGLRKAMCI